MGGRVKRWPMVHHSHRCRLFHLALRVQRANLSAHYANLWVSSSQSCPTLLALQRRSSTHLLRRNLSTSTPTSFEYSVRVIRSGQMRGNKIRTRSGPHNSATSVSLQARRTETPRQKRQTNPCLRHASRLPAVSTRFYKGLESHQGRSAELSSRKYICTTAASW